jgi:hypothetical protein
VIPLLAALAANSTSKGLVNLDGHTVDSDIQPAVAHVGIRFNADGTVENTLADANSWVQIDAATDWIIPNESAPGTYEIRYTNRVGDIFTSESTVEDAWGALSTGQTYRISRVQVGTDTVTCDFEIRLGGTTIATAEYIISVNSSGT